jgi:MFS-type transporter involved in bile tolerance (Atg22 family)
MVGILYGIHSSDSVEQNTMALSVVTAFSGGVWLLCALPWFTLEKHRPGIPLPVGETYWTIGYKTVWLALKQVYKITDMILCASLLSRSPY